MSPSWRDRVRIALRPDGVALLRVAKGLRPQVTHKELAPCDGAQGREKWRGAVTSLGDALGRAPWRGANVTVVLSSHFVRYAFIPGNVELKGKREETAYVRHLLSKLGDGGADGGLIRVGTAMPGRGRVACSVERSLAEELGAAVRRGGGRLSSVQPYLMTAFNSRRMLSEQEPAWFVALEDDCCVLTRWADGQWQDVKTRRLAGMVEDELPRLIAQERLIAVDEVLPERVIVFSPGKPGLKPRFPHPWQVTVLSPAPLPGFSPHGDCAVAWAME